MLIFLLIVKMMFIVVSKWLVFLFINKKGIYIYDNI
jgi:hypothetical protein